MADSQLLAHWEYEGDMPQVVEEGQLTYGGRPIQFEWLQEGKFNRFVWRYVGDDGSWTIPYFPDEELGKFLSKQEAIGLFWRDFRFDSERLRIHPSGLGFWCVSQEHPVEAPFSLGQSISDWTSSQTYKRVANLLSKSSSDISVSRKFHRGNQIENWTHSFGFRKTDRFLIAHEQLKKLCRNVLLADKSLWHEDSAIRWRFTIAHHQQMPRFDVYGLTQGHWLPGTRLEFWAKTAEQFSLPRPKRTRWCRQKFLDDYRVLALENLAAPTQHEQLEARLELRAWAQQHLPPDVWAEIERFEH